MRKTTYQKNNPDLRSPKIQHIRHIKPEFYVHEGVNDMSVNARYAETGAWTCCDKHGRFEWKPRMLKRMVMPYDDVDFESLMDEWIEQGFVKKYEVNGETYGQFFNWDKHQGINLREKQSAFEYPAPPQDAGRDPAHANMCLHVQTRAPSERKGEGECELERKEKGEREGEERAAPAGAQAESPKPSLPLPCAALAKPALVRQDRPKAKTIGQGKIKAVWTMGAVENVITYAKGLSDRDIMFSKKSKTDLLEALNSLGTVTDAEIRNAIFAQLNLCTDDTSYAIFGSQFAANLISSIRNARKRDALAKQQAADKRLGEQWVKNFRAIWNDPTIDIDEWLNCHTDSGDAWSRGIEELELEAKAYRANLIKIKQNGIAVEPQPTAADLLGPRVTAEQTTGP